MGRGYFSGGLIFGIGDFGTITGGFYPVVAETLFLDTAPSLAGGLWCPDIELWSSVQNQWAPKIVGPPCKIKLLFFIRFSSLLVKDLRSLASRSSSASFQSAHPPHPCLPSGTNESGAHLGARGYLRARVLFFWRNKAGGIAGRLRQTTRRGLEGTVSGQRAAGLAAWVARPGA